MSSNSESLQKKWQPSRLTSSRRGIFCHGVIQAAAIFCSLLALIVGLYAPSWSAAQAALDDKVHIAPRWRGLAAKLAADGLSGPAVDSLLAALPEAPTQSPMGRKIRELYQRQFLGQPKQTRQTYYKGVVTQANAGQCRQFIKNHSQSFEYAWRKYGVPPQILAALLFVETRLGKVLGDVSENAFYTLASMAVSTKPEDISQWLSKLPGYQKHSEWLAKTMKARSEWAYRETRALVRHMLADQIPPSRLPGSIYGAVGLCQFMPSNISTYAADGDGDGRIDLFTVADSVASAANYLAKHGWKKDISPDREHALLMTYNHSTVYANTILALSSLIADPNLQPPAETSAPQKKRGKKQ